MREARIPFQRPAASEGPSAVTADEFKLQHREKLRALRTLKGTGRRKSDNRPRRIRMKHCHVSTWQSFSTKKLPRPRTFLAVEAKDLRKPGANDGKQAQGPHVHDGTGRYTAAPLWINYERTEIKEDNIPKNRRWKYCYHENPGYLLPTKHSGLTTEDSITARALAWYVGISRRHGEARNTEESRYP